MNSPRPNTEPDATSPAANVVLTGFMGTGKSTVGRLVAERLGLTFVDTDQIIEQRHGAIADIFATHGEGRFRELEREVAAELGHASGLVVATGGRLLLDPSNVAALGHAGRIFCLAADVDELLARLLGAGATDRPLLHGPDPRRTIIELLDERSAGYGAFEAVETTGRTPAEVADEIVGRLRAA